MMMGDEKRHLFLSGPRACGKSTLLRKYLQPVRAHIGGYFVQRVLLCGEIRGYELLDIDSAVAYELNREWPEEDFPRDCLVTFDQHSKMRVYLHVFENKGTAILKRAIHQGAKLVLMDEIGRFEEKAPLFKEEIRAVLDNGPPVIGVLKQENTPFLDELRARADVQVVSWSQEAPDQRIEDAVARFIKDATRS